jgi:hypothetical protein
MIVMHPVGFILPTSPECWDCIVHYNATLNPHQVGIYVIILHTVSTLQIFDGVDIFGCIYYVQMRMPSRHRNRRPDAHHDVLSLPTLRFWATVIHDLEEVDEGVINVGTSLKWVLDEGGLAVCASCPESLVREAANSVARIEMSGRGMTFGGVRLHIKVLMV